MLPRAYRSLAGSRIELLHRSPSRHNTADLPRREWASPSRNSSNQDSSPRSQGPRSSPGNRNSHPSHLRRNSCLALRVRTLSKLPRPLAHNLRGCVLHRAASGNSLDLFLRWVFQCQPLWRRQRPCSRVGLWEILCMLNQECRRLGLWASHLSRVVMLMPVVMFQLRHRRSRHRVSMEVA